jgi:hypothetical protein
MTQSRQSEVILLIRFQKLNTKRYSCLRPPLSGINKLSLLKFRKYMLLFVSLCLISTRVLEIKHKDTKTQRGACIFSDANLARSYLLIKRHEDTKEQQFLLCL